MFVLFLLIMNGFEMWIKKKNVDERDILNLVSVSVSDRKTLCRFNVEFLLEFLKYSDSLGVFKTF